MASRPSPASSSQTDRAAFSRRSRTPTVAPSRARFTANARPMPLPDPVMMIFLPCTRPAMRSAPPSSCGSSLDGWTTSSGAAAGGGFPGRGELVPHPFDLPAHVLVDVAGLEVGRQDVPGVRLDLQVVG